MIDIQKRITSGSWTLRQIAEASGVSPSTVMLIRQGRGNSTMATVAAISAGLDKLEKSGTAEASKEAVAP